MVEGVDNGFEGGTLFTQRLCAFGFVPDIRLFQLGVLLLPDALSWRRSQRYPLRTSERSVRS
ncbi:FIG00638342: hypothetical protein [Escherichia coli ISC41]|nr:FIG00638342: hypothetical protein [Escherichia coli ISC41]